VTFSRTMRASSLRQEVKSIPLLAYFLTVGALLTALVLLVNVVLEPSKPERPQPAVADISTGSKKPRISTGSAHDTGSTTPVAPPAQAEHAKPPTSTSTLTQSAQEQPSSSSEAEPKPLTRAKPKKSTAQKPMGGRNADAAWRNDRGDAGYSSYAQKPARLPAAQGTSPAEGTLGPH
jgi:hypothetical protein